MPEDHCASCVSPVSKWVTENGKLDEGSRKIPNLLPIAD
jgi:hypothetical protein